MQCAGDQLRLHMQGMDVQSRPQDSVGTPSPRDHPHLYPADPARTLSSTLWDARRCSIRLRRHSWEPACCRFEERSGEEGTPRTAAYQTSPSNGTHRANIRRTGCSCCQYTAGTRLRQKWAPARLGTESSACRRCSRWGRRKECSSANNLRSDTRTRVRRGVHRTRQLARRCRLCPRRLEKG